jgi:hypothetical protein
MVHACFARDLFSMARLFSLADQVFV